MPKKDKTGEPALFIELKGSMPSKKNAWKRGSQGNVYIDKDMKKELDYFSYEIIKQKNKAGIKKPLQGDIRIEATFYVKKAKIDLDNAYTTLQDLLQISRVIKNDSMVADIIATRIISEEEKVIALIYIEGDESHNEKSNGRKKEKKRREGRSRSKSSEK